MGVKIGQPLDSDGVAALKSSCKEEMSGDGAEASKHSRRLVLFKTSS